MTEIKKNELKKISINLPSNLVERVKEYAEGLGINTTSAYIVLLNQALDQKDTLNNLPIFFEMVNKLKEYETELEDD